MATYGLAVVNERFDMLRQLGNSFIVQPNVLKSYMTESHLGRIDARLLRPYLAQRSDYSIFQRGLNLDDGETEPALPHSSSVSGGTERTGTSTLGSGTFRISGSTGGLAGLAGAGSNRLSVMSGVAGAGMGKLREMMKEFDSMVPDQSNAGNRGSGSGSIGNGNQGGMYSRPPPLMYMGMH